VILVDSSVWIDHLRNNLTREVKILRDAEHDEEFCIGDLILLELLQGARDEHHAGRICQGLSRLPMANLLDAGIATAAGRNYRHLRGLGITIRKTADLIIGTFCIERHLVLLHADGDFDPMTCHLGLRCV
jgi:predicted nucleic acid-binding protein